MSYNGVGLSTPRGSGTNGHIQSNKSHLRPRDARRTVVDFATPTSHFTSRAPDAGILDHERRRRVEVKCLELQVSLEDDGVSEQVIEEKVEELRKKLLAESERSGGKDRKGPIGQHERHELAQAKLVDDERMRKALGIGKDHVEGAAFDRELQERKKIERQENWERKDQERKIREDERRKHQEEMIQMRQKHEEEKAKLRKDLERDGPAARDGPRTAPRDDRDDDRRRPQRRDSRSLSPPPRRRGRSPSRSPSPPPRSRGEKDAPRRRSPSRSKSRSRSISRSRSPPARREGVNSRRGRSESRSMSISSGSRSRSRSVSRSRSRSPPRKR